MKYDENYIYRCRHCGKHMSKLEVISEFCDTCNCLVDELDEDAPDEVPFNAELILKQNTYPCYEKQGTPEILRYRWLNPNPDLKGQPKLFEDETL